MPEPSLNLWLPRQNWGTGVGDHIQICSVIPAWQKANPTGSVTIAYQRMASTDAIFNIPNVHYVECDEAPDESFINAFAGSPGPPRSSWWTSLGLDYFAPDKRLYYYPTPTEIAVARERWNTDKLRVVVQNRGGMQSKIWGAAPRITDLLVRHNVAVAMLDAVDGIRPTEYHIRIYRTGVREALSIVATADLFVGFDSGPFYAALGSDVPAIGIFPYKWAPPEQIFYPVCTPKNTCLCVAPDELPPLDVCEEIAAYLARYPQFDEVAFIADAKAMFANVIQRGDLLWQEIPGTDSWVTWAAHEGILEEHLRIEAGVFVDVGAHHGRYAIRAALAGVHVKAFEPNPTNRAILENNVNLNAPIETIEIFACALGNSNCYMMLSEHGGGSSLAAEATLNRGDSRPYPILCKRLDDFEFDRIDLLKIDTEGWENEVLRGAWQTIHRHYPKIVIEGHGCFDWYGGARLTAETEELISQLKVMYDVERLAYGEQTYWILTPQTGRRNTR